MLVADYPAGVAELSADQVDAIEAALRNPARSEMIAGWDVGPQDAAYPFEIALWQLIPLREYAYPWVLIMVDYGERSVLPYDSERAATSCLEVGLSYLEAEYAEVSREDEDEDD